MSNLPIDPASLILAVTTILAGLLYLREYNLRKNLQAEGDQFLQQARQKGWDNLHQSIKKSQAILGQAELEGVKVVAESKLQTSKFEQEYSQKLAEVLNQSQQTVTTAQDQLLQFMKDLQIRSEEFEEAQKSAGAQRINQLFDNIESKLADFLIQTEQKTVSSIELELKGARQLVDTYKDEQLRLIDENILAMMEQTLSIVLSKKLSLKDQLDLIYEALEKAKVEKFIA